MTIYEQVLKSGFTCTNWQVLEINSLIPFEFTELFNGKTWDLLKCKKLLNRHIITYQRNLDFKKFILIVGGFEK